MYKYALFKIQTVKHCVKKCYINSYFLLPPETSPVGQDDVPGAVKPKILDTVVNARSVSDNPKAELSVLYFSFIFSGKGSIKIKQISLKMSTTIWCVLLKSEF